jgi:hypothetical protein
MSCQDRRGVVDRTVDINGMRLHVKALGALGALSWCLSAQNRRSCQLGQLGKNQFLAWIKIFFDFWNILDISASITWGEDGDDSWKESSILCGNIANVRKHHRKSKICTSCPFVLNFSGDFQSHSSIVFALSKKLWPGWEQFQRLKSTFSSEFFAMAQPPAEKQPSWWARVFTTSPRGKYAVDEKQQNVKENEFIIMRCYGYGL